MTIPFPKSLKQELLKSSWLLSLLFPSLPPLPPYIPRLPPASSSYTHTHYLQQIKIGHHPSPTHQLKRPPNCSLLPFLPLLQLILNSAVQNGPSERKLDGDAPWLRILQKVPFHSIPYKGPWNSTLLILFFSHSPHLPLFPTHSHYPPLPWLKYRETLLCLLLPLPGKLFFQD